MGVDISLHIEIRKRNQWHLMTVTSPQWDKSDYEDEIFETEVYNCRYYHFQDFLAEAETHRRGNKELLSEELQRKIDENGEEMEFGIFMFDDLVRHCDGLKMMLISGISHAGIYSIKEQLDRIEAKLDKGSPAKSTEKKREELYEEVTPIEQMYKDFMWDYGCLFRFRDTVQALTSFGYNLIPDSDIRIFYLIC